MKILVLNYTHGVKSYSHIVDCILKEYIPLGAEFSGQLCNKKAINLTKQTTFKELKNTKKWLKQRVRKNNTKH